MGEAQKKSLPDIYAGLAYIQMTLRAPKNQWNAFGKYKYRSCEDILEAVKPIVSELQLVIKLDDEVWIAGDRFYIKATATLTDGKNSISTTAFAREELDKKGMDASQVTGAASSYARKYALNGLFAIDDNKDSDKTKTEKEPITVPAELISKIEAATNVADLTKICHDATTGKSQDYRKAVMVYYSTKKEKLGGEI